MKKLLCALSFALLAAGCSKTKEQRMIVIRDCTGTYLRLNNKDYQVCNIMATNDYPSGAVVKATVKAISDCNDTPQFVCELYHPGEGWIKVIHIEKEQ